MFLTPFALGGLAKIGLDWIGLAMFLMRMPPFGICKDHVDYDVRIVYPILNGSP